MIDLNCHDRCREKQTHSICIMPVRLKVPILAQMAHKLETLPASKQNEKKLWQYARVEQILKG